MLWSHLRNCRLIKDRIKDDPLEQKILKGLDMLELKISDVFPMKSLLEASRTHNHQLLSSHKWGPIRPDHVQNMLPSFQFSYSGAPAPVRPEGRAQIETLIGVIANHEKQQQKSTVQIEQLTAELTINYNIITQLTRV